MTSERLFWLAVVGLIGVVVGVLLVDEGFWPTAVLAVVLFALVAWLGSRVPNETDRSWLAGAIAIAYTAKLFGATGRYLVLARLYEFGGDATAYHSAGLRNVDLWKNLQLGVIREGMDTGTHFVEHITGLIYLPYAPSMLGGFLLFATLGFIGQVFFYLAFRQSAPTRQLPWYAAGIFFLPSMVFWPASIGKESLMLLFLGLSAYGLARVLGEYRVRWTILAFAGLAGAAAIRVHIAALLAAGLAVAFLVGKSASVRWSWARRLVFLGAAAVLVVVMAGQVSDVFGVDPTGDDLDPFLAELERRTTQGGSAVGGSSILDSGDPVSATLRVLFRPLPNEAHNAQALASALESTALMALIAWNLPRMIRHIGRLRSRAYLLMSASFVGGFVVGFSAIFNLGILARQRTQALPFLLAVLVGLSVRHREETAKEQDASPEPVSSLR